MNYLPGIENREDVIDMEVTWRGKPLTQKEIEIVISTADLVHSMYENEELKKQILTELDNLKKPKTMIDFLQSKFQSPSVWERMIFFVLYAAVVGLAVWAANKFTQPMVSETTNAILTGAVGILGVGFGVYVAAKK